MYLHTVNGDSNSKRIKTEWIINEDEVNDQINGVKEEGINNSATPQQIIFYPSKNAGFQEFMEAESRRIQNDKQIISKEGLLKIKKRQKTWDRK